MSGYREFSWKGTFELTADGLLKPVNKTTRNKLLKNFPKSSGLVYWENRSKNHHGLFFSAIKSAYENWPEKFYFQPENSEHLRAWLQCKAGKKWRFSQTIPVRDNSKYLKEILTSVLAVTPGYSFVIEGRGAIHIITPKSISFENMSQDEFNQITDAVSHILEEVTGISLSTYKESMQN